MREYSERLQENYLFQDFVHMITASMFLKGTCLDFHPRNPRAEEFAYLTRREQMNAYSTSLITKQGYRTLL
jgi:hypothetical protein